VDNRGSGQGRTFVAKAIVPDVLLEAHVAPLQFVFYEPTISFHYCTVPLSLSMVLEPPPQERESGHFYSVP